MIYRDFDSWRRAFYVYGRYLCFGLYGVFVLCLAMGTASVFYAAIRQVNAFFRRETVAAGIISVLFILISVTGIGSFIKERHLRVQAQHRADSIAYDMSKLTQMFESCDTIVINGDTLRRW